MSQSYRWVFTHQVDEKTWEEEHEKLVHVLKQVAKGWVFQLERGTHLHFQGRMSLKTKMTLKALTKIFKWHFLQEEKGEWTVSTMYCMKKDKTFVNGPWTDKNPKEIIHEYRPTYPVWLPWQRVLLDHLDDPPPRRQIYYVWSELGRTGKSTLCQYLVYEKDAMPYSCQSFRHITHSVVEAGAKKIYVFDIPRAVDPKNLKEVFTAIENIKDGVVRSSMYAANVLKMRPPHVVIFANVPPPPWLSEDRYMILHVDTAIPDYLCKEDRPKKPWYLTASHAASEALTQPLHEEEEVPFRVQTSVLQEEGALCSPEYRREEEADHVSL